MVVVNLKLFCIHVVSPLEGKATFRLLQLARRVQPLELVNHLALTSKGRRNDLPFGLESATTDARDRPHRRRRLILQSSQVNSASNEL